MRPTLAADVASTGCGRLSLYKKPAG